MKKHIVLLLAFTALSCQNRYVVDSCLESRLVHTYEFRNSTDPITGKSGFGYYPLARVECVKVRKDTVRIW